MIICHITIKNCPSYLHWFCRQSCQQFMKMSQQSKIVGKCAWTLEWCCLRYSVLIVHFCCSKEHKHCNYTIHKSCICSWRGDGVSGCYVAIIFRGWIWLLLVASGFPVGSVESWPGTERMGQYVTNANTQGSRIPLSRCPGKVKSMCGIVQEKSVLTRRESQHMSVLILEWSLKNFEEIKWSYKAFKLISFPSI